MQRKTKGKAPAKKPAAKGKSRAVAKKGNTFTRTSRIAKAEGRVAKLGSTKLSAKQISGLDATVKVTTVQPTQVQGFILASDDTGVILRQAKSSGSSKPAVKHYLRGDILAETGEVNSVGVLTVMMESDVTGLSLRRANVSFEGNEVVATDNDTGDVLRINRSIPGIKVDVVAIED